LGIMWKRKAIDFQERKVAAKVKVDIGSGNVISSTVTVEAVKELDIKVGDDICVLIKASSVIFYYFPYPLAMSLARD